MKSNEAQHVSSLIDGAIPKHVGIIMDGNGRWAQQKGKLRTFGHKAGVESVRAAVRYARKSGIEALTLFAFSSENWSRPEDEVGVLMDLFSFVLNSEVKRLQKNGVRLRVIGDTEKFGEKLVSKIRKSEELTEQNTDLVLNIAANYGGRWDITQACRHIARKVSEKELSLDNVDEALFGSFVSTSQLPELDLLIRTGGEHRISNFLLWQAAYAELYFTPTLWPDFNESEFEKAVTCFATRQRRFGLTGEQVK
jgi:undecaprenyl diphosphate synthase